MSTISKFAIVIVIIVIIYIVSMLLAGYFSGNYGWNVYLNVNNKKDRVPFKEYKSGNVAPGSEPKVIYTNDHTLGQLYAAPLGGANVLPDKILWTKMHADEATYPNPTKRTELRRFNNNGVEEASVTIEAAGTKINSNAAIIQPDTIVDYNVNLYKTGEPLPSSVIGIKGDTKYRLDGSDYTVFQQDGRIITSFTDGTKKIIYKDGRIDSIAANGDVVTTYADDPTKVTVGTDGKRGTQDAGKQDETEGFSFDIVDFNVDAFVTGQDYSEIYAEQREKQGGPPKDTFKSDQEAFGPGGFASIYAQKRAEQGGLPKDTFKNVNETFGPGGFADVYAKQREEQGGRPKDTFITGQDYSEIFAEQCEKQGGSPKDTFGIDESMLGENFDIESSIGIVEPSSTKFLYEIEKENLVIDDYVRSERTMLDSNGNLGFVGTGAVPSGKENFLESPDKYYVDVEGNRIYRRRVYTTTNDNWTGISAPYVDAYGNIHSDSFFEPVHGIRTVTGWFLPPERLRTTLRSTKVTKTWTPHTHVTKVHVEPRFYDSSFNSSVQEVLTDTVLRRDPIGGLIVPAQPVLDSLYVLE